jgi:hypothetical protein
MSTEERISNKGKLKLGDGKAFGPPSSAAERTVKILVGYKVVKKQEHLVV